MIQKYPNKWIYTFNYFDYLLNIILNIKLFIKTSIIFLFRVFGISNILSIFLIKIKFQWKKIKLVKKNKNARVTNFAKDGS